MHKIFVNLFLLSEDSLVKFEFEEIKAAIDFDRTVAANVGWKSLFTTSGNLRRLRVIIAIAFFSQWSGNGLVSYYLTRVLDTVGITDPTIQLLINGILQIWNLFWALLAAFLVDKIGRRILFLSSVVGMLIFFTFQTICSALFAQSQNNNAAHAVIAFIFLFYASYEYVAFHPSYYILRADQSAVLLLAHLLSSIPLRFCPSPSVPRVSPSSISRYPSLSFSINMLIPLLSVCILSLYVIKHSANFLLRQYWLEVLHCLLLLAPL